MTWRLARRKAMKFAPARSDFRPKAARSINFPWKFWFSKKSFFDVQNVGKNREKIKIFVNLQSKRKCRRRYPLPFSQFVYNCHKNQHEWSTYKGKWMIFSFFSTFSTSNRWISELPERILIIFGFLIKYRLILSIFEVFEKKWKFHDHSPPRSTLRFFEKSTFTSPLRENRLEREIP